MESIEYEYWEHESYVVQPLVSELQMVGCVVAHIMLYMLWNWCSFKMVLMESYETLPIDMEFLFWH